MLLTILCALNALADEITDIDADGVPDAEDVCPTFDDPDQEDRDLDGFGDVCDACPDDPEAAQADADGDGVGDACDLCLDTPDPAQSDADRDGIGDACDLCPVDAGTDEDGCPSGCSTVGPRPLLGGALFVGVALATRRGRLSARRGGRAQPRSLPRDPASRSRR